MHTDDTSVRNIETREELTALLDKHAFVVLNFGAPWCHPCHRFAPVYEGFCKEFPQVAFAKLNVEQSEDIADKYQIFELPGFVLLRDKRVVSILSGLSHKRPARRLSLAIRRDLLQLPSQPAHN